MSYVKRKNLSLRTSSRRFTRLTLAVYRSIDLNRVFLFCRTMSCRTSS